MIVRKPGRNWLALLIIALALFVPDGGSARTAAPGDYPSGGYDAEIAQLREYMSENLRLDPVPAISIGFYKDGFIWAAGFGMADLENRVPATAESAYRLASVTKPMTAIALLTLVERGKVDLDSEVQNYVPYFPQKRYPVTVGLLLGHLGGISHYRDYDEEGHFKYHKDTRAAIAVFEEFDLVAEPGTRYQYTSYGYNLLGAVIEGASGRPYGEYMQETLWGPFGMDDTRMDDPYELIPNRVTGYRAGPNGEVIRSEFVDISSRFAAGGTRSTVVDLLKFARGLDREPVLSPDTMDRMFNSMQTSGGMYTDYGMGWGVRPVNGRFRVSHTGGQAETRTYLAYFPSIHFAIAAAANFEGDRHGHYVSRLYQLIMDEPMGVDVYTGAKTDKALFEGARLAFDYGLGYYDRYNRELTDDASRLEAAFGWFNSAVDRQKLEDDYDIAREAIEKGRHPAGGEAMAAVGSHMAAVLGEVKGDDYLESVHGRGAIAFFADYIAHYKIERSFPKRLRFTKAFERTVTEWNTDWERTWNDHTRRLAITRATDLGLLTRRLKSEFGDAVVYPDYTDDLSDLVTVGIGAGDVAAATSAATMAVDLYPRSDRPFLLAGMCHFLLGDVERGRASIVKAHDIDPAGAAGAGSLNGYAYSLKASGYTESGLELLKVALELHPDVANLYDSTAEFYLALGDRGQAIAYYEKALEVDPGFENAKIMLDRIRRK